MNTYELCFSNGSIELIEFEGLSELLAKIRSMIVYNNGFTSGLVEGKILNLNQLVSVRELEGWELYDNNTP